MAGTLAGLVILWLLLDRSAAALESFRGEWGVAICIAVIVAAVVVEFVLSRRRPLDALSVLGLKAPARDMMVWTLALSVALLCFYPAFVLITGASISIRSDAAWLTIGVFAQAGVAEELIFRGFLFRRFRERWPFWRAAVFAAIPFIAVHAHLFFTMEFSVALVSFILAVSISFPFAWMFERGGGSIWPPAIVHAVIQGSIKLVETDEATFTTMAVAWIVVGMLAPWAIFALRPRR